MLFTWTWYIFNNKYCNFQEIKNIKITKKFPPNQEEHAASPFQSQSVNALMNVTDFPPFRTKTEHTKKLCVCKVLMFCVFYQVAALT